MTHTSAPTISDRDLVNALRAGDETAFMMLVEHVQPMMLRVARMYVPTRAIAEEVVQDAWVGVLRGLDAFEGRSSLRTWILRILVNTAKTRGKREARSVPFASVWATDPDAEPAVELDASSTSARTIPAIGRSARRRGKRSRKSACYHARPCGGSRPRSMRSRRTNAR